MNGRQTIQKGRQPGAISKRWRDVFRLLVQSGNSFTDQDVIQTVFELERRALRRSEVARLFSNYQEHGLASIVGDGTYQITDHAIAKFDLAANAGDETPSTETGFD